MDALETARHALEQQLEPIEREYAHLTGQLDVLKQARDQLKAAIAELKPANPGRHKKGGKAGRPSPCKSDVMAACQRLVEANAPIAKADLESLVKHTLKEEAGFSLSGAALLLRSCLASDAFRISPDGEVSLSAPPATGGARDAVSEAGLKPCG
ncbi:hypothetical protein [Planctomycetes bacterium TBK1r]|uniref:Uncharacterized protein n=1 Tax=Stieleria magnilauensis TaxID=2527963 RepID=A0ABX5XIK2_9BACT|nr:hypothetical protein TBK1r_01460 [Planctomycetes bacterium TBK1r]